MLLLLLLLLPGYTGSICRTVRSKKKSSNIMLSILESKEKAATYVSVRR